MALMVGAMTIHGIVPGPQVISRNPDLFWGLIASMWIGNLFLLIINLPLVGIWVRFVRIPYRLLCPIILLFSCIGIYSVNNSPSDVVLTAALALFGYTLTKLGFETVPLLLGFVLGRYMEEYLRRALAIARGDVVYFVQRPISAALLAIAIVAVAMAVLPAVRKRREEVFSQ
jgi:putative tricarboxylic transport membrane protein